MRKRILFIGPPLYGLLYPLISLAQAFRVIGHDVVISSAGKFANKAAEAGLVVFDAVPGLDSEAGYRHQEELRKKSNIIGHFSFFSDEMADNLIDFAGKWRPDLIVYPPLGPAGPLVAIGKGALLDYVIIDEASQQDIVPGILGLGCARNVIVVGDRKQLPHVPVLLPNSPSPPAEYYNCEKYSLLDSVCMLFRNMVPVTLLKEHYRCHPKIIQFCNKQFYDNALIPLTVDSGEASLSLVITAKGNHTRNFSNLRELESLEGHYWDEESSRGYIAPYNAQVNLAEKVLPADFVKSTVHKFQGRECDEIVFSTVLDKKRSSQHSRNIAFVDNPELVNVAVSRARNKFTLVTGNDVFERHAGHIAALIRYIKYYADDGEVFERPVISAFDLLYSEYDKSLERLNSRLNSNDSHFKSEQIVACLLRDILSQDSYRSMMFHSQIALNQWVLLERGDFTHREQLFMRNRASCDFVVYYKVGKTPLGVIEVDGGYHLTSVQAERDELKNSILKKCGLPLLRLRTIDSDIEGKLGAFLSGLTG